MNAVIFTDIGSTFTKVTAVDMDTVTLLGRNISPTTIDTDVRIGLEKAMNGLKERTGLSHYREMLACSSAAGGLSVAVSGLVESLTLKAAGIAALGAGAKILKGFHHELTESDLRFLENNSFDILLLTGGTDGGNSEVIMKNARRVARVKGNFPIVVAGNRNASDEVNKILVHAGKDTYVCPNILPELDTMNTAPVNEVIRKIFMDRIIHAKGITVVDEMTSNDIIPTPYAVLEACSLLSDGYDEEIGLGSLMAVDAGGATTDVHSVCEGYGTRADVLYEGLMEPRIMRTVEGDIGVRWNIDTIVGLMEDRNDELSEYADMIRKNPSSPVPVKYREIEARIARKAIETAVTRHCGKLKIQYTPRGARYVQKGKDLTGVKAFLATGGPIVGAADPESLISSSLFDETRPENLCPENPDLFIDSQYIMAAAGLMSTLDPKAALLFMKKYIMKIGRVRHD